MNNVSLARQTLRWDVGKALQQDIPNSDGTAELILLMDKWFKIITCSVNNSIHSANDERLDWLDKKFVQYLLDWQTEVDVIYPGEEKRILSRATLQGLVFTYPSI
ncbi:uncharacterized protein LOC144745263 [Ciona intestinalis]